MISVRKAKPEDIKTIHTHGENVGEFNTSNATVTFWPENILQASVDAATVFILVAENQDKDIIGFIIANCNKPLSKILIENIYVQPTMRNQGVGAALVQAIVAEAEKKSYEFISVLTPPYDLPAIKTYVKSGFIKGEEFLWLDYSTSTTFRK